MPVAILGDSDSHSYRDQVNGIERGGEFHLVTHNWPGIWVQLRGSEVFLGDCFRFGTRMQFARLLEWFGLSTRSPRKMDFEFNYSVSGLKCESLTSAWPFQGFWLLSEIDRDAEFWKRGLVIIRIGVNDLGQRDHLERWAQTGLDQYATERVAQCVNAISGITTRLLERTSVKVAIVGIAHDYNWPDSFELWQFDPHILNISEVLGEFDERLAQLADESARVAFIDDIMWFRRRFGDRRTGDLRFEFSLSDTIQIRNAQGDHPYNLILEDGHAGTVGNALWLASLVDGLNREFGLGLTSIRDEEIVGLIDQVTLGAEMRNEPP